MRYPAFKHGYLDYKLPFPLFQASAPARIVNVSSIMHDMGPHARNGIRFDKVDGAGYKYLAGYDISKLANVLHANELARRLEGAYYYIQT